MKHLKNLLVVATILISSSLSVNAQSKVAHINTQELVEAMPDMKNAKSEIKVSKSLANPIRNQSQKQIQSKCKGNH